MGRRRGWVLPPELPDEAVIRYHLVRVQEKCGQQRLLLPTAKREHTGAEPDLERAEEAELELVDRVRKA